MAAGHSLPCIAVSLLLLACSRDPAAPPAFDGADGGTSDARVPTGPITMSPPDSGMASVPQAPSDAGPPPRTTRVSLIDHNLWTQLGPEQDPFEDRPEEVECAADAVSAEVLADELAYGVDTGACSYVTAEQVTRQHVTVGETIVVRLWHFALDAPNPGEAHAVVDVDGLRLLDERVAIPAPGGLIKVEVPIERTISAGAPVYFHLHNHGANSWALVEISTGPTGP